VPSTKETRDRELLLKLSDAIGEWEDSSYYLPEDELFDLERFLEDHEALGLKSELEAIYGTPLNYKFWSSFLAYHRLKRARQEIKAQDEHQEEKRQKYVEAVEEEKRASQKWLKEWFHHHKRQQIRVLPGGKSERESR
jgi:hypothetical protein